VPFYLGGDADVVVFPKYVSGMTYVTSGLTGPGSDQKPKSTGNYELMICTREEADWAANLISKLARYTTEAVIELNDTMECPIFEGSEIMPLLFASPEGASGFSVLGADATMLLLIGITSKELAFHRENGGESLLKRLKDTGVYPYTDLDRRSVV